MTVPGNRQEVSGEDVIISIELPRPGNSSESSSSSSGSSSSSPSKAPSDRLDGEDDDPLRSGGTTLGRIAANNGSNDSIPGAADWVAGYLSRNKTEEDHSHEASPSNSSSSVSASKSPSSSSTSASASRSAKSVAKADGANAAQEQAVKNADADDSGLSGIAPLILFSLIGLVLIALAIRYFSRGA